MKFIYYLAAIGSPNLSIKLNILENNIKYIYNNLQIKFDIIINYYDKEILCLYNFLKKEEIKKGIDKIYIHQKCGILVELWLSNPYNKLCASYDYILYNMDDVEIMNMDINELINIKKKYEIEFLSPRITNSTWNYMHKYNNNTLAFTNRIEIYTLLFTYKDFYKFMSIQSIDNPNTWGVDLLLAYFNIKTAIYYKYECKHQLPSNSTKKKALLDMNKYLNKYNFKSMKQVTEKYTDIINTIEILEILE